MMTNAMWFWAGSTSTTAVLGAWIRYLCWQLDRERDGKGRWNPLPWERKRKLTGQIKGAEFLDIVDRARLARDQVELNLSRTGQKSFSAAELVTVIGEAVSLNVRAREDEEFITGYVMAWVKNVYTIGQGDGSNPEH